MKEHEIEELKLANSRMEKELNLAKDIQLDMIPRSFPAFPGRTDFDLYAKLIPAREVGGDFYDYYLIDNDHLALTIGDVSGKGVASGMMMMICKLLLKSTSRGEYSTANILTQVNEEMLSYNTNYMFVTVFMCILNLKTGELVYTNAGHNPSFVLKKSGGNTKLTDLHGPVVAAMEDIVYKETKVQLEPGDILFAYTDGITEAHNLDNQLFSEARLQKALERPFKSVKDTIEQIFTDILFFERGAEQFDDITALCLEFKG